MHRPVVAPLRSQAGGPSSPWVRNPVLAAGVALGLLLTAASLSVAAGHTDALLLSCMDYRLVDDTARYMEGRGLRDRYDHVVLAGASLGALSERYPAWSTTFWDHLDVAIDLHGIRKVIVLDHRDCGAYRVLLGEDLAQDPDRESEVHAARLRQLRAEIAERHPELEVELLLMALDGSVETVSP